MKKFVCFPPKIMKVYALVGKSGTGKSYQAINLCKDREIESIIDDGLFIYRGNATAGKSAKREETKIGAIKAALFNDDNHCKEVVAAIKKYAPESILLIGTSDGMVEKIADRLEVGEINERIYIEDITTEGERKIAEKQRHAQGKHVIPVSSMQLKYQFSGYFLSPLRIFRGMGAGRGSFTEKSVVRPTYSYMGNFIISDRVFADIIKCTAKSVNGIKSVVKVISEKNMDVLDITVYVIVKKEEKIVDVAKELQEKSFKMVEDMTAFNIKELNIEVKGLA